MPDGQSDTGVRGRQRPGRPLVVAVTDHNDKTWFDRAGDFHSDALHVVERYRMMTPDAIWYEATKLTFLWTRSAT